MSIRKAALALCLVSEAMVPQAQVLNVDPQIRTRATADGKVLVVEIAAHFVTAIRLQEAVNSVAVGDPALFQVEHSEREPELVLVKLTAPVGELACTSLVEACNWLAPIFTVCLPCVQEKVSLNCQCGSARRKGCGPGSDW